MKTHFKYDELIVVCDLEEDHVHFKVIVIFFFEFNSVRKIISL